MAHPLYMLCCLSGSVDRKSNQVSHFHVVEQLQINFEKLPQLPPGAVPGARPMTLQIVSTWVRDEGDGPEERFDVEVIFHKTGEKPKTLHKGAFLFGGRNHRFTVNLDIIPNISVKGGEYKFESRIRKSGSTRWVRQTYVIPVEVTIVDEVSASSTNGKGKAKKR